MCSPGQPLTIFPSLCPHSPWLARLFPLPSLCNPNCLRPWPVRDKAQSVLKCSRKRRKVIKGKLMAQQTLLGSLLKWAQLFWPYRSQLWWFPCFCSSWGNIQVRNPWQPGTGLLSQDNACGIYPCVTSLFFSLLAQRSFSININVSWSAHSFWIHWHPSADNLFWVQQAGQNAAVE